MYDTHLLKLVWILSILSLYFSLMDAFEIITLKDFLKGAEVEIKCTLSLELLLDYISMPDNETFLSNCQISHDDCVKLKNYGKSRVI